MPCRRPRPARYSSTSSRSPCAKVAQPLRRRCPNSASNISNFTGRTSLQKRNATVAVIGAGDYIGGEIAKKVASEGLTVFAGRRHGAQLEPPVKGIEGAGGGNPPRGLA